MIKTLLALTITAAPVLAPALAQDCTSLREPVQLCGPAHGWMVMEGLDSIGPDVALLRIGGPNAAVVVEPVNGQTVTLDALENAALLGLSTADSYAPEAEVLSREMTPHLGLEWRTLVYRGQIGTYDVVYANTMTITDTHAIQLITVANGTRAYSDAHRADHALFTSLIQLEN